MQAEGLQPFAHSKGSDFRPKGLAGGFGAWNGCHLGRIGGDPDAPQIETVGIVAGVDGRIAGAFFLRVESAGMGQLGELF